MIDRREIIDSATRQSLNPHVVEKDIVLSWVLAGINVHPDLRESWVFKGGTCLKKCYFETYRFSEDLDFTLRDAAQLDAVFLTRVFEEVGAWVYERSGIEMPAAEQSFDLYANPRGNMSCQGKLGYRGPISPRSGGWPRIKLDLTADEAIVLDPVLAPVYHPYSDAPEGGIEILAYDYVEAFGEKIRALGERTRPRDLYDVVNLFRHEDARPDAAQLLDVLRQKCAFKGIGVPRFVDLAPHEEDLRNGWGTMLAHQLPALPPVDGFWLELPAFFAWLEGGAVAEAPIAYAISAGDTVLRARNLELPVSVAGQSFMEIIRFAAANRLLVELRYQGSVRTIEPYSLRRTLDGNILLEAHNVDRNEHRSYRLDRIEGAQAIGRSFSPRYAIELTPEGPVSIPQKEGHGGGIGGVRAVRSFAVPQRRARQALPVFGGGPRYVYSCPYCGKRFTKKTMDASLNPHKDKNGWPCSGRHGIYEDTKW